MARDMRAFSTSGGAIMSVRTGVWAGDANDFIFIAKVENEQLYGLNLWRFDENKNLSTVIFSEQVDYVANNEWLMKDAVLTRLVNDIAISKESLPEYRWRTSLAPDKLAVVTVKPEELSLTGLSDYVPYLKASEQDSSRYELALWRKVTQPITIAVMMLMALSFILVFCVGSPWGRGFYLASLPDLLSTSLESSLAHSVWSMDYRNCLVR